MQASISRDSFVRYAFSNLGKSDFNRRIVSKNCTSGAALETSVDKAARSVIGDPTQDQKAMLPPPLTAEEDPDLLRETHWIQMKLRYDWGM